MMSIEQISALLGWCALINYAALLFWAFFFVCAHDWMYRFHGRWFKLPIDRFDAIHYAGMTFYKLCIFVFNLAPYIALRIVN